MKNIIVFGATGFIGKHYANFFDQSEKINVINFDIISSPNVTELDVRETINIEKKFHKEDVIINLAAVHKTPGHPDYDYYETNIRGAENVCKFAEENGINNIIFTSSIAPYGASEELKTELTLTTPNTPYGISKLVAEYIHKEWASKDVKNQLLILRPGVVFGKGENGNFTRLAKALKKGIFFYPGRKDTIKASIYVKELVHQSWQLLNNQTSKVETYNFAYYPERTIEDIVKTISEVHKNRSKYPKVPSWFLNFVASQLKWTGIGSAFGIHPDRVKKLMISTNISGKKLYGKIEGNYIYTFEEAIRDWYNDCDEKGLY